MADSNGEPSATANGTEPEFVVERVFEAPRETVFRALTEPERLQHWWGPRGFTWVSATLDLRPGGVFHYCMRSPDGHELWGKFVYREIAAPERLVFVNSFSDADGNTVRAPFNPDWPLEVLNTVTLVERNGKTALTLRGGPVNATEAERKAFEANHDSMRQGFTGTFDQLAAYLAEAADHGSRTTFSLPSDREFVMERVFDAPRELVFRVMNDPAHLPRWWGPSRLTTTVETMDVRQGGRWRVIQRDADGNEYAFNGVYREVVPPEWVVRTFEFEGMPGHVAIETATFEDLGGRTRYRSTSLFQSPEDRDAMLASGAESGASEGMDRLAELLQEITKENDR